MHTFSPAKMWIEGLQILRKPLADLHTQFNRDIPWDAIDMDFMNLNQTAHGGREFGHIGARLRLPRKAVVGHWEDPEVHERLAAWARAARGWHCFAESQTRPHRRQHATRFRHGRRQGFRADAIRLGSQYLRHR
jgi:L-arabinose isomerase